MFIVYLMANPSVYWRQEETMEDVNNLSGKKIKEVFPEHSNVLEQQVVQIENEIKFYQDKIEEAKKIENDQERNEIIAKANTIVILNTIRLNQFTQLGIFEVKIKEKKETKE